MQPLDKLKAETEAAIASLFTINLSQNRQYETGDYFFFVAQGAKRIKNILGIEKEVIIVGNSYKDQQVRSVKFARVTIDALEGRVEANICIFVHQDPRGNAKLKRWGREHGLAIIPIYTPDGIMPRGQELERTLSFEFFTQDPFDITGPVANDSQFFGRRTEAQELARKLQLGQIRSCFGIRKIGKTSILHRVLSEIKSNYEAVTIFVDCQRDDVFNLTAASLLNSITATLNYLADTGYLYSEVDAIDDHLETKDAAKEFQAALKRFAIPVIVAFDEIDYITPSNAGSLQWRSGFVEFWRNVRAAYHAATRDDRRISLLVSGVSSRWFMVESVDGTENAALAFVPEEYVTPLPRGAAKAMIKATGAMAGLRFDEPAQDFIAASCSDMPFWIRKACSFFHGKIETSIRPVQLSRATLEPLMTQWIGDEGSSIAHVALQHLFRVYPELREPALRLLSSSSELNPKMKRTLVRYGICDAQGRITGAMMKSALELVSFDSHEAPAPLETKGNADTNIRVNDWAEELSGISYRRNLMEKSLRSIVINFVRVSSLSEKKISIREGSNTVGTARKETRRA
ncbi:hypothetical protein B9J07_14640 [Sinorhizobium sp. LM21]|nr:hypothetical protein B9J07_14640 [Sinorhizobium sp. LM21]